MAGEHGSSVPDGVVFVGTAVHVDLDGLGLLAGPLLDAFESAQDEGLEFAVESGDESFDGGAAAGEDDVVV